MRTKADTVIASLLLAATALASLGDRDQFMIDTTFKCIPVPGDQFDAAVGWTDSLFLVVWVDCGRDYSIYGCRLTPDGVPLDSAGFLISASHRVNGSPSVTSDGKFFFVVWHSGGSSWDIWGARISLAGAVLDTGGIPVAAGTGDQTEPSVAYDGVNYMVSYVDSRHGTDQDGIYAVRVSPGGVVLDSIAIPVAIAAPNERSPALAFCGTSYLVVWTDIRNGQDDVYACRVTPAGQVLEPGGFPVSVATGEQRVPAVAFDGSNFLVVWQDCRTGVEDIYASRVSPEGIVLDPDGIAVSVDPAPQWCPAVASDGSKCLVVWEDHRNGTDDIYGCRVTRGGGVLEPGGIPICTAIDNQHIPAVASGSEDLLVAWCDGRIGPDDIFGARVNREGVVLDTFGFRISTAANYQREPAVAAGSQDFLIVWSDEHIGPYQDDIYASRVDAAGRVLDPLPRPVSTFAGRQFCPAVAAGSCCYLAVWNDERLGGVHLLGSRISMNGAVLDPEGIPIAVVGADQRNPAVAFDGENFLVVWQDCRDGAPDIYGARVSQNGEVLDGLGFPVAAAANDQQNPAVTFDGVNYLVTWYDRRSGSDDVVAARVTPAGVVLDPLGIRVSIVAAERTNPAVAAGPGVDLVTWEERRNYSTDIYGSRVNRDGAVLDPFGLPIATGQSEQLDPAAAYGDGGFVVVWQTVVDGGDGLDGCRLTIDGAVTDTFRVVDGTGNQQSPALAHGEATFMVYQGWTTIYQGRVFNANRIWGSFGPFLGGEELVSGVCFDPSVATTILRRGAVLQVAPGERVDLLDVTGRRITTLGAGACLGCVPAGTYFLLSRDRNLRGLERVRKVVVQP